jgi:hypothetical protein
VEDRPWLQNSQHTERFWRRIPLIK